MKITKDAIKFFYRMFFSCYMTGKKSSEDNRKVIEENLSKNTDFYFEDFCSGLQEWETRRDAIIAVAKNLNRNTVDREVIAEYFGGPQHTEVILGDLDREAVPVDGKFYRYTIFNHMLVPLRIERIAQKEAVLNGVYENNGVFLNVKSLLFFEKDRKKIIVGKTVLCHFPMVIDTDPSEELVQMLLELQRTDEHFMRAVKSFPNGIDHSEFFHLSMLRKRML